MSDEIALVQTGYEQACHAYDTAVNVTFFTWQMFYVRSAALMTAAGVICVKRPRLWWVAASLLVAAGVITWVVTSRQMSDNQIVLRKAMAAGIELEQQHPELGCRFLLDGLGHGIMEANDNGKPLSDVISQARSIGTVKFSDLGVTPKTTILCRCYACAFLVLAVMTYFAGRCSGPGVSACD